MRIFHCKRLIIKSLSFIIGRNFVSWKVKPQKELATTSQEFQYLHRKSPSEMLKFQRRSCKLSFLFPPRRQCSPESWLAGYPAGTISHFSKSADDYWYSLFTPSKWPHFNICKLYPSLILPDIYACARRRVSLWHWRLFTQSLHQSLRILWLRMSLCPQSGTLAVLVEDPDVQDCQAASDLLYVI